MKENGVAPRWIFTRLCAVASPIGRRALIWMLPGEVLGSAEKPARSLRLSHQAALTMHRASKNANKKCERISVVIKLLTSHGRSRSNVWPQEAQSESARESLKQWPRRRPRRQRADVRRICRPGPDR